MDKHRREELIAGGVVLGGLTLLFLLLAMVTDRIPWGERCEVEAVFDDVRGLKKGDPVFFHGVPCGRVAAMRHERRDWRQTWPEEPEAPHVKVALRLEMEPEIAEYLRTGSRVTVEKTITGITAVVIREGEGEGLPAGQPLRGDSGAAIEELAAEAQSVGHSLNELIADVRGVVGEIREGGRISKILESLHATARNVEEASGAVRDFTGRTKESWVRSVEGVESFAKRILEVLDSIEPSITELVDDAGTLAADLAPRSTDLAEAISSVRSSTEDLAAAASDIRSLLARNRSRLDSTVRDVARAADNVSEATAEIRRQPWRLLYRPDAEECSTLCILDAVREYNIATSNLQRAFEELLVLKQGPAEAEVLIEEAATEAESALKRYRDAESALWAELKR